MRQIARLLTLVLLVLLAVVTPLVAQELPRNDLRNTAFRAHMVKVVELNPQISDFQRMREGEFYRLPGGKEDYLYRGDSHGIWGREFAKWYGLPYEEFLAGATKPMPSPYSAGCTSAFGFSPTTGLPCSSAVTTMLVPVSPHMKRPISTNDPVTEGPTTPTWFWWVLVLAVLVALAIWLYRRPTNWRPVVADGVETPAQAASLLADQARRLHATVISGSQQRVRLYGTWAVRHQGIPIPVPHHYNAERAWRARFRMANGTERAGYMILACGNDVAGGSWYTALPGAHVEEGWGEDSVVVPPTPVPAPVPSVPTPVVVLPPVVPTPEPAAPVQPPVPPVVDPNLIKIEVKPPKDDKAYMVKARGIEVSADFVCEVDPVANEITVRFTPKKN